ncbi:universal stress protein [Desulfonatronospira sp. MSAO_Bac3]|uniref:universal stress protein n=1 Tax=Desulfonatronospira sp. MSAO_Bac3 TaxID=2293857 RepID=UPI000FF4E2FF|nr:universal stress protein [Desulfonatronospira sp. MSAO_Bac3]RQD75361.1 MAG: universal stress protein [Desulfonatronospira sp. MSAO_Bac3]
MKLLVPHDGSEFANKTLDKAIEMAEQHGGGTISSVVVVPDLCISFVGQDECNLLENTLQKEGEGVKKAIEGRLAEKGVKGDVMVKAGAPEHVILETADQQNVDYIVMGASGKHGAASRGALGGVTCKVINLGKHNVIVIKK